MTDTRDVEILVPVYTKIDAELLTTLPVPQRPQGVVQNADYELDLMQCRGNLIEANRRLEKIAEIQDK